MDNKGRLGQWQGLVGLNSRGKEPTPNSKTRGQIPNLNPRILGDGKNPSSVIAQEFAYEGGFFGFTPLGLMAVGEPLCLFRPAEGRRVWRLLVGGQKGGSNVE